MPGDGFLLPTKQGVFRAQRGTWLTLPPMRMCLLLTLTTEPLCLYSMLCSVKHFRNGGRWAERAHVHSFCRWQNEGSGNLAIHTKATQLSSCRARPRNDSARECGPAKAMAFLVSVMKVVRTLQRDEPPKLWHVESSGGGQGSIAGACSQEGNGYSTVWLGLEVGCCCEYLRVLRRRWVLLGSVDSTCSYLLVESTSLRPCTSDLISSHLDSSKPMSILLALFPYIFHPADMMIF